MLNIQLGPIRQVLITKSATKEVQKDSANNSVAGVISAGTTEERLLAPELSPLTVDSFVSQMLVATEADQAAVDPLQPDAAATDHQGLLSLTLADSPFVSTEHILKIVATTASELGNVLLLQNGMAYINLNGPPGNLTVPGTIGTLENSHWTTWSQGENGAFSVIDPTSLKEISLIGNDLQPVNAQEILGGHSNIASETGSVTTTTTWSDLVFNADGSFQVYRSELTTIGGAETMFDSFNSTYKYTSAYGSSAGVSSKTDLSEPFEVIATNAQEADQKIHTDMFGTYRLLDGGLSIEMSFADGTVRHELISRGDAHIDIGSSIYLSREQDWSPEDKLQALYGVDGARADWLAIVADSIASAGRSADVPDKLAESIIKGRTMPD